jgi:hypothetical protein
MYVLALITIARAWIAGIPFRFKFIKNRLYLIATRSKVSFIITSLLQSLSRA